MIDGYYLMVMGVTLAFIHGLHYCTKEGEIFYKPAQWLDKRLPEWVTTPLFNCPYCMASVWGTSFFIFFLWGYPWYLWVVFCFCLTGLSALIKAE